MARWLGMGRLGLLRLGLGWRLGFLGSWMVGWLGMGRALLGLVSVLV